ncbi:MAG TPA: hypothetical protein VE733_26340 [Streptosporangiaceae bacterium]|nr:hypothetical protein [Streptosporangiaceae bacterium]
MTLSSTHAARARRVADAILYEGYLLYPYRQSSRKNQARFQFGVLMPPAYRSVDDSEPSASQTECLVECPDDARVEIAVRFLHVRHRTVQAVSPEAGKLRDVASLRVEGTEFTAWTEAAEREEQVDLAVSDLAGPGAEVPFHIGSGESAEDLAGSRGVRAGRLTHRWAALDGVIRVQAERVAGPYRALRLRVRVENHSHPDGPLGGRDDGLRYALIAAHSLIGVPGGSFISMTDHPEWAAAEVAACTNIGTWPVLAGPAGCRDLMLSSPVILYDHPEIAPESAGDLFDATEIDEILTLRTMALTDEEKQEARATDPRAADLIDRLDGLPPEMLERLHGAIRYLEPASGPVPSPAYTAAGPFPGAAAAADPGAFEPPSAPWWDPGADTSVSPETDHVVIEGIRIARGSRVRMRPGTRRADAQDLFLIGREALVEAVLHDVDGQVHVAVSPVSDPVAELQRSHGRFLYFAPDELEPAAGGSPADELTPGNRDDREPGQEEETT